MALLTPAQFAQRQANLPPEDRISYAEYVRAVGGTLEQLKTAESAAATPAPVSVSAVESAAAARAKAKADADKAAAEVKAANDAAAKQASADAYYTAKVGNTGKTQAQLDALQNAIDTAAQITESYGSIGITSTVDLKTGKVVTTNNSKAAADAAAKAAADKAEKDRLAAEKAVADAKTAKELADAKAALIKAQEDARIAAAKAAADLKAAADKAAADLKAAQEAGNAAAIKAAQDAKAAADAAAANGAAQAAASTAQANLNVAGNVVTPAQIAADVAAKAAADKIAADAQLKESNRQSIITILQDRFAKYGLTGLGNKIKQLAIDGATEATITLGLQETDEYKTRFKANEERLKKGLTVLQPAEYLNLEDGYRQVLRSYGLTAFDNDDYVQQFISNDVSAAELSNRVVTAVQRVQNADPAVIKQLGEFYGITSDRLVAYVLDPQQQFQKIERQVAAGEIGVAAGRQGLKVGVQVAEQLAAQGITQAEAQKGYSTIADILPTAEKLSAIYGSTTEKYGQSEAEQEVFNSLASAQRARQKLSALEVAQFGGSSGLARGGLTQQTSGNF
jgi:hypothetical protein